MSEPISRRKFLAGSVATTALAATPVATRATNQRSQVTNRSQNGDGYASWLDPHAPAIFTGATWGMPWPRGQHKPRTEFVLETAAEASVALQSWPLAYWPDGSLKWTAHALAADVNLGNDPVRVVATRRRAPSSSAIRLTETDAAMQIDTGLMTCILSRTGSHFIQSIKVSSGEVMHDGKLVLLRQDQASADGTASISQEAFESQIEQVECEQRGPARAVIRINGRHVNASGRGWLPFTLRLYFYAGSDALRIVHSFVFDGDESRDCIRGVGVRFNTNMRDALHDRHVRFAGQGDGVFGEAVRGLTGLRRDPGKEARDAQVAGRAVGTIAPRVSERLDLIPAFGDWSLLQANADSFIVRKRTSPGHSWLESDRGRRASGLGYIGGPSGGVAFGIRDFWQSHPAQLDVRNATSESAEVTAWIWAPDAQPMDLRFYHDGLGQTTYEKQLEGLDITYEDYESGFGTPMGVARTSELMLWMLPATPTRERFGQLAAELRSPSRLVATPETLQRAGVFARSFSLPQNPSTVEQEIDKRLAWLFDFYRQQQDERSWYGFWNYGDVMHTYDADRHTWRYDVGGYAWDNSELSTDIWLWLYFLRSGRADVFRFAEAMTRHTGEVDVHHLGRFAPLGSRHNVMHWGCSAKQLRISTALNRRYYYFLTADERVGDLMREQIEAARTLRTVQPERKLPHAGERAPLDPSGEHAHLSFGTDWGSIAGAWLTEWERTQNRSMRARLVNSMRTIAAQPKGFFTGSGRMNLTSGAFDISTDSRVSVSHLSAAFGLPEVCAELIELLAVPEFEQAWLQYCELYNATADQQVRTLGQALGDLNLQQGHSRLTAYAAYRKQDGALAQRSWQEFYAGRAGYAWTQDFRSEVREGPATLNPVTEAAWVSTNETAQWGLAAIECLAWAGAPLKS